MSDDVIRVSELSYAYTDDFPILSGLDVQVPRGSFYGLLGRNGTGKTTLIRILLGMLRPAAGGCEILGLDPRTQAMEIRGRVGYVPQENDFDPQMTIGQTLDFIRSFYRGRWSDETVKTYMQRFELSHRKGERIEQLSGGLKQLWRSRPGLSLPGRDLFPPDVAQTHLPISTQQVRSEDVPEPAGNPASSIHRGRSGQPGTGPRLHSLDSLGGRPGFPCS